jgi:hypothetical protein
MHMIPNEKMIIAKNFLMVVAPPTKNAAQSHLLVARKPKKASPDVYVGE